MEQLKVDVVCVPGDLPERFSYPIESIANRCWYSQAEPLRLSETAWFQSPRLVSIDVDDKVDLAAAIRDIRNLKTLTHLRVCDPKFDDVLFQEATRCPEVKVASFRKTALRDLPGVENWPQLATLTLKHSTVTSRGVQKLKACSNLSNLSLEGTSVTDEALFSLSLLPLSTLNLASTDVTDSGLAAVSRMSSLSELDLSGTKVTGAGLFNLRHCLALRHLKLSGSLTPAELEVLSSLPSLEALTLYGTEVEDRHLTVLKRFPALRKVCLTEGHLTKSSRLSLPPEIQIQLLPATFADFDPLIEWLEWSMMLR